MSYTIVNNSTGVVHLTDGPTITSVALQAAGILQSSMYRTKCGQRVYKGSNYHVHTGLKITCKTCHLVDEIIRTSKASTSTCLIVIDHEFNQYNQIEIYKNYDDMIKTLRRRYLSDDDICDDFDAGILEIYSATPLKLNHDVKRIKTITGISLNEEG